MVRTEHGPVQVDVPRDRAGSFEPKLILKHSRQFAGFDDEIVSMHARASQFAISFEARIPE